MRVGACACMKPAAVAAGKRQPLHGIQLHRGPAFVEKTQTSLLGQLPLDDGSGPRVRRTTCRRRTELHHYRFGMVSKDCSGHRYRTLENGSGSQKRPRAYAVSSLRQTCALNANEVCNTCPQHRCKAWCRRGMPLKLDVHEPKVGARV